MKQTFCALLLAASGVGCGDGATTSCAGTQQYMVQLTATGLDAYEGKAVRVMTSVSKPEGCRGTGAAIVAHGAVALTVSNGFTPTLAVYPSLAAYVDRDDDGRCNDGLTWTSITTAIADRPTAINLTSADFTDRDGEACSSFP